jgi:hypothetical protein
MIYVYEMLIMKVQGERPHMRLYVGSSIIKNGSYKYSKASQIWTNEEQTLVQISGSLNYRSATENTVVGRPITG